MCLKSNTITVILAGQCARLCTTEIFLSYYTCSDDAGTEEMKDGILDRHYYEESYLHMIGMAASKKLGKSHYTYMSNVRVYITS